jgi:hypothetical protein
MVREGGLVSVTLLSQAGGEVGWTVTFSRTP